MQIINPHYAVNPEKNIFIIRQKEFSELEPIIQNILKPVEDLGFLIKEFAIKDSRHSAGDLNKTLKQNISIKLEKNEKEINISLSIPTLVDDNYIMIGGRKKIPQFQLFDVPIITRGKSIKIRTNVATLVIEEDKHPPFIKISILGKKVPLADLIFAYYGRQVVADKFKLATLEVDMIKDNNKYGKLMFDLKETYKESLEKDLTQDDHISTLGENYSKFNFKSKGEDVIYALDIILKCDVMSARFFKTGDLLNEIIDVINNSEGIDDLDFKNKRIRCFEYIVLAKMSKIIFDLCLANRTLKQPKFNVNSSQILTECNVSDIIQFDFAINPIEELTKLSRISLVGPGGFDKQNIPEHLRDIMPSMFGRICPVDTPDRENCGVLHNILPNVDLDDNLKFTEKTLDKTPVSIPVAMVPFLEHDDQTRLQMSSSQMRQAIMLKDFDQAHVQSGCEGLYTDYTQFIKRAKGNGEVVFVDNKYIIVIYEDTSIDIFDVAYRKIYVGNMDIFKVYVKQGDKIKKGDILAESNFSHDGRIQFGKNLLTGVMIHYGYNYEDGIVISDKLVQDGLLTSAHFVDLSFTIPNNRVLLTLDPKKYKPLPEIGEEIKAGNPYVILKEMPMENMVDYYSVFEESNPLLTKKDTIITEINVHVNEWNENIPEYNKWIKDTIEKQRKEEEHFHGILETHLPKETAQKFIKDNDLDKFSATGKYKSKGEPIPGTLVEMYGIFFRPIRVGDKIGNRHGNKGIISNIVPKEKMPKLSDGRHLDICINPLGIISRMNIGQLFELHLAMSLNDLKSNLSKLLDDKVDQDKIKKYLLDYIKLVDNTNGNWYYNQFKEQLPTIITEDFIKELFLIQPPFESCSIEMVEKALKYTGTEFTYDVHDPISGTDFLNKIAVGYMYFFRMVHIAESRLAARGIASYAKRTLQPLAGRKNKGGQRCGEMETACLIAHDVPANLYEFQTTKSDCIDLKNKFIREQIETDLVKEEKEIDPVSESVKLLYSYLTVLGVEKNNSAVQIEAQRVVEELAAELEEVKTKTIKIGE